MSPSFNSVICYLLITMIYIYLCFFIKQIFIWGLYNVYPLHFGFLMASIFVLCLSGITSIALGRDIQSIPALLWGIIILWTALWVFQGVDTPVLIILLVSTLIVVISILSGFGARYMFVDMTLERFRLYVFIAVLISFFVQQILGRR